MLGISWGKSLTAAVNSFSVATGTDVVQLVGGVTFGASNSDVGGPLKTAAIATALRSDLLTTLITDTRTATRLLDGTP